MDEETTGDLETLLEKPEPAELRKPVLFRTYRQRWFLLVVVCLLNCSNAMVSTGDTALSAYPCFLVES